MAKNTELDPNSIIQNNNTHEQNDNDRDLPIKEQLVEFSNKRQNKGVISNFHTRQTYLIANKTIEKLENLVMYLEATNGLGSELSEGTEDEILANQLLAKGTKSKLINMAIDKVLTQYEQENFELGGIPDVQHKRYSYLKGKTKMYLNYYMFTDENGETYGIEQDNRSKELKFLSTEPGESKDGVERGVTKEYIQEWFDSIENNAKPEGRPKNDK